MRKNNPFQHNSNYSFSNLPNVSRPRSVFDRSRTYKTTFNAGFVVPFYIDEILPGDTIANLRVTSFARLTTPIVPFMDNLYMDFFFFYVPTRLVWSHWKQFCGEQSSPGSSTDFLVPQVNINGANTVSSIFDYFGLPIAAQTGNTFSVNALPFRCYNLIFNTWFKDENLQADTTVPTGDGPDPASYYSVRRRLKRKADPFTSALPWPQKGPGVELPLGATAPVYGDGVAMKLTDGNNSFRLMTQDGQGALGCGTFTNNALPTSQGSHFTPSSVHGVGLATSGDTGLIADLSGATAATINSLREAFQIQRWYEAAARSGTRYNEIILGMFGVNIGDARLQRPEYLGGGTTPIQIHSVAQTSSTDTTSPQGNLAAYGVSGQSGIGFSKSFVEHGYVIGLVSVRGDYTYQQGVDRMWSRKTKFDFYWPQFAHLGEVGILNKEIYCDGSAADDNIFGYQERWYEYRYGVSKITGKLRNDADGTLSYWHLGQFWSTRPVLNDTFMGENPPVSRVLAVQNEPQFLFDSVIHCRMARVMPVYSVPGLIDHF